MEKTFGVLERGSMIAPRRAQRYVEDEEGRRG